ncbi:MAG TPA: hypothetical protein VHT03_06425 [Rhizomicrobium sp.]|nr:hypothetical protein [Rhizomicrobium sp.]
MHSNNRDATVVDLKRREHAMHVLIEEADKWLATPATLRSNAIRDKLISRLTDAPQEENWSAQDRELAADRRVLLEETTKPVLGFLGGCAWG